MTRFLASTAHVQMNVYVITSCGVNKKKTQSLKPVITGAFRKRPQNMLRKKKKKRHHKSTICYKDLHLLIQVLQLLHLFDPSDPQQGWIDL